MDRITIDRSLPAVLTRAYAGSRWRDGDGREVVVEKFAPRWPTGEVYVAYAAAAPEPRPGLVMDWGEFQRRHARLRDDRGRLYQSQPEGAAA